MSNQEQEIESNQCLTPSVSCIITLHWEGNLRKRLSQNQTWWLNPLQRNTAVFSNISKKERKNGRKRRREKNRNKCCTSLYSAKFEFYQTNPCVSILNKELPDLVSSVVKQPHPLDFHPPPILTYPQATLWLAIPSSLYKPALELLWWVSDKKIVEIILTSFIKGLLYMSDTTTPVMLLILCLFLTIV